MEDYLQMICNKYKLPITSALVSSFLGLYCYPVGAENIIQQEKMSFETCLKVIKTSEDKLAITSQTSEESSQRRIALFELSDGTLKITCDGETKSIIVSTQKD